MASIILGVLGSYLAIGIAPIRSSDTKWRNIGSSSTMRIRELATIELYPNGRGRTAETLGRSLSNSMPDAAASP